MSTDSTPGLRVIRDVPVDVFSFLTQLVIERNTATEDYLAEHLAVAAGNLNAVVEDVVVLPMSGDEVEAAFPHSGGGCDGLVGDPFAPVDFGPEAGSKHFENEVAAALSGDDPVIRAELIVSTPEGTTSTAVEYDPEAEGAVRRVVLGTAIEDVVRGVRGVLGLDEFTPREAGGLRVEDMACTEVNVALYHDPEVDITQAALIDALSTISQIRLIAPAA